jgi:uridine kinase
LEEPPSPARVAVLADLADRISALVRPHPIRVAIDGPDTAGKTTLADELAGELARRCREVVRASIDGFHRARPERHLQGRDSALGYYEDSFNYRQLARVLLDPLGPGGSRLYRSRVFDYRRDLADAAPLLTAAEDAILLFDGVFLLRPELAALWDLKIFLSVTSEEIIRRARIRDAELFGSADEAEAQYRVRYLPAQVHYSATALPHEAADIVIANDDPQQPVLVRK